MNQIYKQLDQNELVISDIEAAARLKTKKGYTNEIIKHCESVLRQTMRPAFSAAKVSVKYPRPECVDFGFGEFQSEDLYENLNGAKEAFIFAVTLGIEVDRLLIRLYSTSPAEHFITDAIASALAEAACDKADSLLRSGLTCGKRFSPGYGDFPLETQPKILETVNAGRLLNITLSKTLLMVPKKSITAVMGIIDRKDENI